MSDFDYGNARLRAMKSRLLPRWTLAGLAEAGSVPGLIAALTNTAYREAVEAALARTLAESVGWECLAEALRNDLVATVGKARRFFSGAPGELIALALRRYDLHNVKTVLRGLARQVPAIEILAGTLPVAELRVAELAELARAANVAAALDLLATWRLLLARPLLELRARAGEVELPAMELALDHWHLSTALQAAREADHEGQPLLETLRLEADATNILTALRVVGVPGADGVERLFVGPGYVSFARLAEAAHRASAVKAVEVFSGTPYGATLTGALEEYAALGRLSVFERALALRQLRHAASLFARDSLGMGVLLGYVALKTNEIANLRAIAQGLMLGEKAERIRAELMFAN